MKRRPRPTGSGTRATPSTARLRLAVAAALAAAALTLSDAGSAFASITPGGMVSDDWSFSGAPSGGMTKLAFPITVNSQPDASGYYWAQQFYLKNNQGGYLGLQPRTGGGAALFSIFGNGTSTTNPNCHSGADGGAGTSCLISYPYSVGHEYELEVIVTGTNTYTGYVVDDSTAVWTTIGSWTVSGGGNLQSSGVGFQEYYTSVSSCSATPYGQAHFWRPFTNSGQGTGSITAGGAYGNCAAEGSYSLDGNGGITMTGQ